MSALRWHPEWPVTTLVTLGWLALITIDISGGHQLHSAGPITAWSIMAALMMVPVTLPAIRHVAFNSFRIRRARAMTIYLAAYLLAWIGFGMLARLGVDVAASAGLEPRA